MPGALANDMNTLSGKSTGSANTMAGKYDWRPGPGVPVRHGGDEAGFRQFTHAAAASSYCSGRSFGGSSSVNEGDMK